MKTAIEKAIEDIESYRSFSDTIEIRFVCALLRNVYLGEEKRQIIDACNQPYFDDISAMGKPITKGEQYYDETFRGTMQKQALQFLSDQAQELNMGYKKEGE